MIRSATRRALATLAGPLRRLWVAGTGLASVAAAVVALAVPAWLVRLGIVRSPLWVVVAWVAAGLVTAAAAATLVQRRRRLSDREIAGRIERSPGWRRGSVVAVLEGAARGGSAELFAAADDACAERLERQGPGALTSLRAGLRRRSQVALFALGAALALLVAAGPGRHPVAALWSPAVAWARFVAPVGLVAERTNVDRGETVSLTVRAPGRAAAQLWTRGKGEAWRAEAVDLDSAGVAVRRAGPLASDLFAFVTAGGRTSDTVLVSVRLPVFLGSLALTARYPAYLGLEDEPLPTTGDTLLLPAGTRIDASGESTAPLARAAWRLGDDTTALRVDGVRFRGRIAPRRSGLLQLDLVTADGAPLGSDPIRLPIELVPDRPPLVELPVPESDTSIVQGTDLALVIDARDDHGLAGVTVESRRLAAPRREARTATLRLPLPPGTNDHALFSPRVDLSPLELQPGDTIHITAVARDNAPSTQIGRSRTVVLVVPTRTEARAEQRSATQALARSLDSLVEDSRTLQRQTEDLSRERTRTGRQGDRADQSLAFDEARRAEQVAKDQQELLDEAEAARSQLEELERASEQAGEGDTAFRRRLEEIRDQLDQALSPELRKRLEQLREALKNLDPQSTRQALENLSDAQQKLREALERTRELFKRAALEGELSSLEQEASQLTRDQQAWNERVERADSAQAARDEQTLAARADSVAQGLDAASRQMDQEERSQALEQSAEQVRQAAQQMREASQSARSGQSRQARQKGEQAAQQLSQAQREVQEQREGQQQEWRKEVLDALDRALAETARLSERQLALAGSIGRGSTIAASRAEQAVIEEAVQKILTQVTEVGGKNALVSPQIGAALVQARLQMGRAREAISSASANVREAAEQAGQAVDALNVAAFQMLRSRDDVSGSSSASGLAEAIERMQQMAGQQGALSQDGQNLLSMLGMPQFQQQLGSLAQRQRQLAEEMERLRAQTQAPGMDDLTSEARELARKLEAGRLDRETIERQERLFRRMLDAGRTLQGEEKDEKKERESTTARGDSVSIPPPLRRLLDADGRIRFPTWDELQRLSPEERRLVTDYFRRLTSREVQ